MNMASVTDLKLPPLRAHAKSGVAILASLRPRVETTMEMVAVWPLWLIPVDPARWLMPDFIFAALNMR